MDWHDMEPFDPGEHLTSAKGVADYVDAVLSTDVTAYIFDAIQIIERPSLRKLVDEARVLYPEVMNRIPE